MLRHRSIAVLAAAAGLLAATAGPAAAEQFVIDGPYSLEVGACDAYVRPLPGGDADVRIVRSADGALVRTSRFAPPVRSITIYDALITSYMTPPQRETCGLA